MVLYYEYCFVLADQELAPREAQVHYLLGRAYKRLRQVDKALAAFQVALDLRPSTADKAQVKAAMDKVHLSDDEEEEEL
jgi:anaphase-promoting complex subunit 3